MIDEKKNVKLLSLKEPDVDEHPYAKLESITVVILLIIANIIIAMFLPTVRSYLLPILDIIIIGILIVKNVDIEINEGFGIIDDKVWDYVIIAIVIGTCLIDLLIINFVGNEFWNDVIIADIVEFIIIFFKRRENKHNKARTKQFMKVRNWIEYNKPKDNKILEFERENVYEISPTFERMGEIYLQSREKTRISSYIGKFKSLDDELKKIDSKIDEEKKKLDKKEPKKKIIETTVKPLELTEEESQIEESVELEQKTKKIDEKPIEQLDDEVKKRDKKLFKYMQEQKEILGNIQTLKKMQNEDALKLVKVDSVEKLLSNVPSTEIFKQLHEKFKMYHKTIITHVSFNSLSDTHVIMLLSPERFEDSFVMQTIETPIYGCNLGTVSICSASLTHLGDYADIEIWATTECSSTVREDPAMRDKPTLMMIDKIEGMVAIADYEKRQKFKDYNDLKLTLEFQNQTVTSLQTKVREVLYGQIKNDKTADLFKSITSGWVMHKGKPPKDEYLITWIGYILAILLGLAWIFNFKLGV